MSKTAQRQHAGIETGVVSDLTHDAEGVVRPGEDGGKIAFVAGALPGERIRFQRRGFHKSHDEAELVEILEASPDRVTPRCAHFGVCGGCALQHLDPAAQLASKQKERNEINARIADLGARRKTELDKREKDAEKAGVAGFDVKAKAALKKSVSDNPLAGLDLK